MSSHQPFRGNALEQIPHQAPRAPAPLDQQPTRRKEAAQSGCSPGLRRNGILLAVLGMTFALGAVSPAASDTINVSYSQSNLSGSQWTYSYSLSGMLSANDLLAIYFPVATSSTIVNLTTAVSGFTTFVLQPDTTIPAAGEYDILATSATSSFPNPFAATFTYSGTGTPGAQAFTLYDSSFATILTGTTVAAATTATPEPGSLMLLAMGFAVLFGRIAVKYIHGRAQAGNLFVLLLTITVLPCAVHAQGPGGGTPPGGGPGGGGTTTAISGINIGSYNLLSSYRSSTYQYYYTFTTSATNTNSTPYSYVLGTLTSSNANTVVVSGAVEFGLIPAGGSATGLTSFTILQDRRYTFDPSSLSWSFTGSTSSAVGTTTDSVTVSESASSVPYGTGLNLTASVVPATATGTVTFYDGPFPVGTSTLTSGTASLTGVALPAGSHNLSSLYSGDTTYAASSSSPAYVAVTTGGSVASCSGLQATALVVCLANAFESTLTSTQLTTAQISYTLANSEVWSNLPGPTRNGLKFSSLTSTQLAAAMQLAQVALSAQGYARARSIIGADNILGQYSSGYGSGNYSIAILGTPSTSSPWMLQIGGHHLAINHTFNGNYVSGTPYSIGSEPAMYNIAGTTYFPMQGTRDAAYALTRSIYGNSAALLSGTFDDVLTGSSGVDPYPRTYPTSGRGILYSSLTQAQQAQVIAMIEAWVADMDSATASSLLSSYESSDSLANTYVG